MDRLTVLICAYNEKDNIIILYDRLCKTLRKIKDIEYDFVFMIDGNDGTYERLKKKTLKNQNVKIFHSEKPQGFANSFRKGFREVKKSTDYIITMDADLNHMPEDIPRLYKKIKDTNSDIVIGSRKVKGAKTEIYQKWKIFLSDTINKIFSKLFKINVLDKTSGYRVLKAKPAKIISEKTISKGFEYLMEVLIISKRLNYKVEEAPITFKKRIYGESKLNIIKTSYGYMTLFFKTMMRDLK